MSCVINPCMRQDDDPGLKQVDHSDERPPEEIAQRMVRGLQRAFRIPHQPHGANPTTPPTPKATTRRASKGRVDKGKTRS